MDWVFFQAQGFLKLEGTGLRQEGRNLKEIYVGHIFSTQEVVVIWNEVPEKGVEADSILTFRRQLDRYLDGKGVEGYEPDAGKCD